MMELAEAGRVPVFLELRRYDGKLTFREFLIKAVAQYQIPCDSDVFDYLADSGKLVLLLDAFDEIDTDSVTSVLEEIEFLAQRYPKTQIVITSLALKAASSVRLIFASTS